MAQARDAQGRFLKVGIRVDDKAARGKLARLGVAGKNVMAGMGMAAAGAAVAVTGIGIAGVRASLDMDREMAKVQTLLEKNLSTFSLAILHSGLCLKKALS